MKKANFGKRLIEVRKAKGLTQEEVAKMCNVTVRTIQRIESGSVVPRAYTIKIISETLGFDFFKAPNAGYEAVNEVEDSNMKEYSIFLWYIKDLFNLKTNIMKKISILVIILIIAGFSLFTFVSDANAQSSVNNDSRRNYINNKDRIEVAFTDQMTFDSLVFVKDDLKTRGIVLNFKLIKFDENNKLEAINFEVDCNDGYKGSFSSERLDSNRFGFYRDYSGKSKSPFGTGLLK